MAGKWWEMFGFGAQKTTRTDVRLAYHAAADQFGPSLDIQSWVDRLRAELPPTRLRKPVIVWRGQAATRPLDISWTTYRGSAEHYARRPANISEWHEGQAAEVILVRAVAPPEAVLGPGHPDIGDEDEITDRPSKLEDV